MADTVAHKYQHLVFILEEESPKDKRKCQVKYCNMVMNRFSIRARDRFEVYGFHTIQVPNNWNNCFKYGFIRKKKNLKKRQRIARQQFRVQNII